MQYIIYNIWNEAKGRYGSTVYMPFFLNQSEYRSCRQFVVLLAGFFVLATNMYWLAARPLTLFSSLGISNGPNKRRKHMFQQTSEDT